MGSGMWQLQASAYGSDGPVSTLEAASLCVCAPQPGTRQKAVEVLMALAKDCDIKGPAVSTGTAAGAALAADVDLIFQHLCVVAATDNMRRLRLAALKGLAGLHHTSTAIKLQALSKKATLRILLPSTAQQAQHESIQQLPSRKRKQQQQQQQQQQDEHQVDAGLLDAATGALVHGTEDDVPQVRLAAVEAVISLASHDVLFADAAGLLLSDLINDQLQDVRLAALQALLVQARLFWQHKQQHESQLSLPSDYQPQQQQQQQAAAVHSCSQPQGSQQQQQQLHQIGQSACNEPEVAADMGMEEADQLPEPAAGCSSASQHQRPGPRQKPRKSDLPPWGRDAMLASAAALSDDAAGVRQLALQLLCLLPPSNVPDLVSVMSGLVRCVQRSGDREQKHVREVVQHLAVHRAEMVTLAVGKLVPLLAGVLQQTSEQQAAAGAAAPSVALAVAGSTVGTVMCTAAAAHLESTLQESAPVGSPVMAVADAQQDATGGGTAAAAAWHQQEVCVDAVVGGIDCELPLAASLLTQLLLAGVQQRHQGVPALLKWVHKAHLEKVPSLQPWLRSVRGVQQAVIT